RDLGDHRSRDRAHPAELPSLPVRAHLPRRHPAGNLRLDDRGHVRAPGNAHEPDDREARPRRVGAQPPHPDPGRQHPSRAGNRSPSFTEPFMKRKTWILSAAAAAAVAAAVSLAARARTGTEVTVTVSAPLPAVTVAEVKPIKSAPREEITG